VLKLSSCLGAALFATAAFAATPAPGDYVQEQQRLMREFNEAAPVVSDSDLIGAWKSVGGDLGKDSDIESTEIGFGPNGGG
jgi:hypothetical protein